MKPINISKKTMKKIFFSTLTFIVVAVIWVAHSQDTNSKNQSKAQIVFDNIKHDFGIIPYMSDGSHIYVVTNTGTEPLIIINCVKGCGCTAVDWTKDPIKPGGTGLVKATFNTRILGHFSKGVDVYSNDPINSKVNLRLMGTVVKVSTGKQDSTSANNAQNAVPNKSKTADKW